MIIDDRKAGYLASLLQVPPLIFRFQFNPEALSEKKSMQYGAGEYGQWGFDKKAAGSGLVGMALGLAEDVGEMGAILVGAKPRKPEEGGPRQINLDFVLDARLGGPKDGDEHFGGSIEPDLAILRAFMYPKRDFIEVAKLLINKLKDAPPCNVPPPECSLKYGGLSLTCVMTDLNIKMTAFQSDGSPARAEVSVTLVEQTNSVSTVIDFVERNLYQVPRSLFRQGIGQDMLEVSGIQKIIDLF